MRLLSEDARTEIQLTLVGMAGADARAKVDELAGALGISPRAVYRISRQGRPSRERARGSGGLPARKEILEEMMSFTYKTDAAATDVIRIYENNGHLEPGRISPAWFTRWLKAQNMSRKQMKIDSRPCRRFEASEPGEVFQIDPTPADQFYIDGDGTVGWDPSLSWGRKRKDKKRRLVLFAAIDDHSRYKFAQFSDGQTVNHWLNFEFDLFKTKEDPRVQFRGIPRTIYIDNDTVAKSPKFARAHKALGIEIKKHEPTRKTDRFSNARSKGKIERFLRVLSEKQKVTKLQKFKSIEEANQFLSEVCLEENQKKHSTTGEAPVARWSRIRPEMLVECNDDRLYEIFYRDIFERRVASDLTIRLEGRIWQLDYERPFIDMVNRRVTVYRHPLEPDRIYVEWEGRDYLVQHRDMQVRAWAEGPAHLPKSDREHKIEELEAMDLSHLQLWGFDQGPAEDVAYPQFKTGVQLDTSRIKPAPARVSRIDAMLRISAELGRRLTAAENNLLNELLADQATEEEIARALEQLTAPAARGIKAG